MKGQEENGREREGGVRAEMNEGKNRKRKKNWHERGDGEGMTKTKHSTLPG